MFGGFKNRNRMENLGVTLSNSFGRFAPELHDARPAPIAVIASDKFHEVFITIKDSQYVMHMDDAEPGSIPYTQLLGPVSGELFEIPERIVATLEWIAKKKRDQGDYRRALAFFGDIRRLASDRENLKELQKWAAKEESDIWWNELTPKNSHEMNGLFNSLIGLGLPVEYARLRVLGARAYLSLVNSGDARFNKDDVKRSYEMGLEALEGLKDEGSESVRSVIQYEINQLG